MFSTKVVKMRDGYVGQVVEGNHREMERADVTVLWESDAYEGEEVITEDGPNRGMEQGYANALAAAQQARKDALLRLFDDL